MSRLETLREELRDARNAESLARTRVAQAQLALNEALAEETPPHPLLGRKVRRKTKPWGYSSDWKTERGVMRQAGPVLIYGPKGHRPRPGEAFVLSHTGKTRYDARVDHAHQEWELDE